MEERNKGRKGKKKKEKWKKSRCLHLLSHIFFSFQFQTDSPSPIDLLKIKSIPFTIHSHNNGMHESNEIKIDRWTSTGILHYQLDK